jgi:predicted nucleic-acid-binding protein
MIAVDTNVVVRLLVADDPDQSAIARRRAAEGIFISHGVLMETEWVLRTGYRLPRGKLADALRDLLELSIAEVEDRDDLRWAVDRYRRGADWSDLLHLIAARAHAGFATFDRALPRESGADAPTTIEVLR